MEHSPVIVFTYNRADTTQKVIESLANNKEAADTELYIFSDAPKNEGQTEAVNAVRAVIDSIDRSQFKRVTTTYQTENKGLAGSIIDGVTEVLQTHNSVIVLEDDCVVSPYFLNYMNNALATYEHASNIGAVSGFVPTLQRVPHEDVFAVMRSCSLGWGTWKRIWEAVDFDMPDYKALRYNPRFIRNLNKCGNDRMYRLIRQKKYKLQSWSIRFGAHLAAQGLLTVYPKRSYVENIGLESGGVHSSLDTPIAMKTTNQQGVENPVFPKTLSEDRSATKEFRIIYGGKRINQLKRTVYVWGGERILDAIRGRK